MTTQTTTSQNLTFRCGDCGATFAEKYDHYCLTADLPRAIRRGGPRRQYALRRAPDGGHILWVDVPNLKKNGEFAGTSYVAGYVFDPDNFEACVFEAEEEMRYLMADARREFGF